jgi:CheY-like chemotaxis protein
MRPLLLSSLAAAAVALAGCGPVTRGLESVNQPVVSRTDYAFDVRTGYDGLAPGEDARLGAWFDTLRLGYGDRITIDDPAGQGGRSSRDAVASVAAATACCSATRPDHHRCGAQRRRARRREPQRRDVPGCPDFRRSVRPDFSSSTDSNYGCATNSNLAMMVADPEDLLRGRAAGSDVSTRSTTRALKAYNDLIPTGAPAPSRPKQRPGEAGKMNAPFHPRPAATREPFAAYVCDDATAELIKPVVSELGWAAEKINRGGLRNAVQSLSVSASPNILFVDLSESGDPLSDINALAEVCEPGTVVIAAGLVNDVRLYRDLVASGIQDYLLKPFSVDQLRDAFAQAQMTISGPRHTEQASDRPHLVTALVGVRGGVGTSTLATSCAWLFGDKHGRTTALLDLDVHFGTGALALDLEPGRGLTDAIENPSRIDGLFLERAMVKANPRLSVLSAEAPITSALLNDGTAFHQLQEEMKSAFECTVVDMPRSILVQYPQLMHEVQTAVVVGRPDAGGDPRHHPGAVLAQDQRPAVPGHPGPEQGAGHRPARDQPQGLRGLGRAQGRRRAQLRRQARRAGGQARQAARRDRQGCQARAPAARSRQPAGAVGGRRRGRPAGGGRVQVAARQAG